MTSIELVSLNTGKKQRKNLAVDLSTTGLTPGVVLNVAKNNAKMLLLPCSGFSPSSLSSIGRVVFLNPSCKQNQIWKFPPTYRYWSKRHVGISYQRLFHAVPSVGANPLHNHHKTPSFAASLRTSNHVTAIP